MAKHLRFLPRTVMTKNNDVSESLMLLTRILNNEGIMKQAIRWERFEKPCKMRQRLCHERCRRIYHTEMKRKVTFLMRKNRRDPFPR